MTKIFRYLSFVTIFFAPMALAIEKAEMAKKNFKIPSPEGFENSESLLSDSVKSHKLFVPEAALAYLQQDDFRAAGEELVSRGTCSAGIRQLQGGEGDFVELKNGVKEFLIGKGVLSDLIEGKVSETKKNNPFIPESLLDELTSSSITVVKSEIQESQYYLQYSYWRSYDDGSRLASTEVIFYLHDQLIFLSCTNKNLRISRENTERWRMRVFFDNGSD